MMWIVARRLRLVGMAVVLVVAALATSVAAISSPHGAPVPFVAGSDAFVSKFTWKGNAWAVKDPSKTQALSVYFLAPETGRLAVVPDVVSPGHPHSYLQRCDSSTGYSYVPSAKQCTTTPRPDACTGPVPKEFGISDYFAQPFPKAVKVESDIVCPGEQHSSITCNHFVLPVCNEGAGDGDDADGQTVDTASGCPEIHWYFATSGFLVYLVTPSWGATLTSFDATPPHVDLLNVPAYCPPAKAFR